MLGGILEEIIKFLDKEDPDVIMLGGDTVDELTLDLNSFKIPWGFECEGEVRCNGQSRVLER